MSETYDYIIAGGGTAGCVLAARLSERADVSVLLLESGPRDTKPELSIPPVWVNLWDTEVDEPYQTEPQTAQDGLVHDWHRGHTLGGGSSINGMIFLRGHRNDFDSWGALGAVGWAWNDVLPYFQRLETVPGGDPTVRGTDGPMRPAPSATPNALSQVFIDAAASLGNPITPNFNGHLQEGVGWHELSITGGFRQSAAVAYLHPAESRSNLTVSTDSRATRLLMSGNRVTGVQFRRDGAQVEAPALREVIVSSGSLESPRLLLLSGVGPADGLRGAGIDVRHDLPGVGRNLHDHPLTSVVFEAERPIADGLTNHAESSMLWRSDPGLAGPDMQLLFAHVPYHLPHRQAPPNSFTLSVTVTPRSRGSVSLRDASPDTAPVVDPRYLSDSSDLDRLVEGVKVAREVAAARPFDGWRGKEVLPGANDTSRAALEAFVRRGTGTYHHPVGTCAMGTGDHSVVSPQLRVHGVAGLRVVDASIIPKIGCVNTNATVTMIAERAADIITGA